MKKCLKHLKYFIGIPGYYTSSRGNAWKNLILNEYFEKSLLNTQYVSGTIYKIIT